MKYIKSCVAIFILNIVYSTLEENVFNKYSSLKFQAALQLGKQFPNRVILVRYEDLSMNPYETVDKLIDFLNLPPKPKLMDKYLESHTGQYRSENPNKKGHKMPQTNNGPYGTKRKSSEATAFKWAHSMTSDWLEHVEEVCFEPMKKLGYAKLTNPDPSDEEILVKSADEVWPYFSKS